MNKLNLKYGIIMTFLVLLPILYKHCLFPYSILLCMLYGACIGNICVYAYRYQKQHEHYKELLKTDAEIIHDEWIND